MTSLSPEDALLHACVRSSEDLWVSLSDVCDVAQILHSHPSLSESVREAALDLTGEMIHAISRKR